MSVYEPLSGRGIRVDGFGYQGYQTSVRYDSLLAMKLIAQQPDLTCARRCNGESPIALLCEFWIAGAHTNIALSLQNVLRHPALDRTGVHAHPVHRRADRGAACREPMSLSSEAFLPRTATRSVARRCQGGQRRTRWRCFDHGKLASTPSDARRCGRFGRAGRNIRPARVPLQGTIVSIAAKIGDTLRAGELLFSQSCGSHEDGARDRSQCQRCHARNQRRTRRYRVRGRDAGLSSPKPTSPAALRPGGGDHRSRRNPPRSAEFSNVAATPPTIPRGRKPWRNGARQASVPHARTSPICAIRIRSSNTHRSSSRDGCAGIQWKT